MDLKSNLDKIKPWLKPIILSGILMLIPYRIAFIIVNESNALIIESLFWFFDQQLSTDPLGVYSSWEVFIAACILAIPPIWFSGITSIGLKSRHKFAFVTCIIDWMAYVIMVPDYLFEYNPLEDALDARLNLTFFVTLILLGIVIIPTLFENKPEISPTLSKRRMKLLALSSIIFPTSIILPIGETLYSLRFDSTFWTFLGQATTVVYPFDYYYVSGIFFSIQVTPTFPLGVMGWIINFVFIYQIIQYSRGRIKQRPMFKLQLLGLSTLVPTILNNFFIIAMGYQPYSNLCLPIPSLFFAGLLIMRKLQPTLLETTPIEEVEIPIPILHRLRSRLWRKEK